jgi:hypothetical protein
MIRSCGRSSESFPRVRSQIVAVSNRGSGRVAVEDVRVVDRTTIGDSLEGVQTMTSWACISYVVANRTNGDIYVIDEDSRHDGLRADSSDLADHRAGLWRTHRDVLATWSGIPCGHGAGVHLIAVPSGKGRRLGECVPLETTDSKQRPFDLRDIDRFDVVVSWGNRPGKHSSDCGEKFRDASELTQSSRGFWQRKDPS